MSTIYKRKDRRYEGRIYRGRNNYISVYGASRSAVEQKLNIIQNTIASDSPCLHTFTGLYFVLAENIFSALI